MQIRHIIWDWNGTLFNDAELCWEICRDLAANHHVPTFSFDDFREHFTIPVSDFWNALLGRDIPSDEFTILGAKFHEIYFERRKICRLHHGAESVIRALAKTGISHSILSSHPQFLLETGVSMCNVTEDFILFTGNPGEGGSSKIPLGHSHLTKLRDEGRIDSGIRPDEMLLIGDTVHDFELAQALGVNAVLFTGGAQAESHLRKTEAPLISTLGELLEIVAGVK